MSPEMKNLPPPHFPIFAAAALAALCPLNAPAAIEAVTYGNFEISYFGLGDTDSDWLTYGLTGARDWSSEMKSGVERSVNYWNSVITTDSASAVKIACIWDSTLSSGALGGASSANYYDFGTGITLTATEALWREGISATDVSDATYSDYAVVFQLSTSANFYYGESASGITSSQYDFQSMFTHEIGHAMGFTSYCGSAGWSESIELSGTVGGNPKQENVLQASTFDTLMATKDENGDYVQVISEAAEKTIFNTTKLENATGYSTGTQYVLALDEEGSLSNLLVYNPSSFEDGSSMSHVYSEDASETDPLMYKSLNNGEVRRELLAGELEILAAMGWSVIPEPSAFGLLAGTFALALVSVRRRRKIS